MRAQNYIIPMVYETRGGRKIHLDCYWRDEGPYREEDGRLHSGLSPTGEVDICSPQWRTIVRDSWAAAKAVELNEDFFAQMCLAAESNS